MRITILCIMSSQLVFVAMNLQTVFSKVTLCTISVTTRFLSLVTFSSKVSLSPTIIKLCYWLLSCFDPSRRFVVHSNWHILVDWGRLHSNDACSHCSDIIFRDIGFNPFLITIFISWNIFIFLIGTSFFTYRSLLQCNNKHAVSSSVSH